MPFITLKKDRNNYSKCCVFSSSVLLHLFFTSNSVIFVDRGRKIIPCPRAQGTLATPLLKPDSSLNVEIFYSVVL